MKSPSDTVIAREPNSITDSKDTKARDATLATSSFVEPIVYQHTAEKIAVYDEKEDRLADVSRVKADTIGVFEKPAVATDVSQASRGAIEGGGEATEGGGIAALDAELVEQDDYLPTESVVVELDIGEAAGQEQYPFVDRKEVVAGDEPAGAVDGENQLPTDVFELQFECEEEIETVDSVSRIQIPVEEFVEQDNIQLPELLSELLASAEVQVNENYKDVIEAAGEEQDSSDESHKSSIEADQEFIAQIEAFIAQLEISEEVAVDESAELSDKAIEYDAGHQEAVDTQLQPRQAFVEVLEAAQQLQQVQAQIEAIGTLDADSEGVVTTQEERIEIQEQKEALKAKLYEICEQFLESIGVEPTEKKVQALVDRVLKIDFEEIEKEHQFSPEQLATMGTHEYKVGDWFQKRTKQTFSLPVLSPHKIIGLFALQHVALD